MIQVKSSPILVSKGQEDDWEKEIDKLDLTDGIQWAATTPYVIIKRGVIKEFIKQLLSEQEKKIRKEYEK